ncbi:MAG: NUDIX hydrolase [Acidimicrobiales bacterium]
MTRPELCVGAVAIHDDCLLLIERATEPGAGQWSLPGGRVEHGETMKSAVEREVREETGLVVTALDVIGWVERIELSHHFVIVDFRVAVGDTLVPTAGDDARDAAWVPLSAVPSRRLVEGLLDFLVEHGVLTPG